MKPLEKILICICLPFAYLIHCVKLLYKRSGKFIKIIIAFIIVALVLLSLMRMTVLA